MNCSFVAPHGSGGMIEIHGTEGSLSTPQRGGNPAPDGMVMGGRKGADEKLLPMEIPGSFHPFDDDRDQRLMPFRFLVKRFVEGIETGTSPTPNLFDAYRCQQIIDAIQESTLTGAKIQIPSA